MKHNFRKPQFSVPEEQTLGPDPNRKTLAILGKSSTVKHLIAFSKHLSIHNWLNKLSGYSELSETFKYILA